jgi:acetyl esterase/lipase
MAHGMRWMVHACATVAVIAWAGLARAQSYQIYSNITYNGGTGKNAEKGDLYLPTGLPPGTLMATVVVLHGGDWSTKSKRGKDYADVVKISEALASAGIAAFAIDYTLYNPYTPWLGAWPDNLQDTKTAIQWVRVNGGAYGLDPSRIGVTGTSSGAHLAALAAMTLPSDGYEPTKPYPGVSTAVNAAFLEYCPCVDISANGKIPVWLGPNANQQTETDATPNTYVRPGVPPIMLVHGSADTTVPIAESYEFQTELVGVGALPGAGQVEWTDADGPLITYATTPGLIIMDGLDHGFPIYEKKPGFFYDLRPNLVSFFQQYMPPPAP